MNKLTLLILAMFAVAISYVIFANRHNLTAPNTFIGNDDISTPSAEFTTSPTEIPTATITPEEISMKLTSSAFTDNGLIPSQYTCDGDNISPPLSISTPPGTSVSLVLIVDDPDAPGGDWVHWLVWNIDTTVTDIQAGSLPIGAVQGLNDFGDEAYGGPCPPQGTHRYLFKLYALDTQLDLPSTTTKQQLLEAMGEHIIEQSTLTGLYQRL